MLLVPKPPSRPHVAYLFAAALTAASGSAAQAMECTTFVKQQLATRYAKQDFTGLTGNAGTWARAARAVAGSKAVSTKPAAGMIMVFAGSGDRASYPKYASFAAGSDGHVALVRSVNNANSIQIDHANWRAGKTDLNVNAMTSDGWTTASVYNLDTRAMGGGRYAVAGFINPAAFPAKKK